MKLLTLATLLYAGGLALASGVGQSPAHNLARDEPTDVAAQKSSVLAKLATIIPTAVATAMHVNPTAFNNDSPPEFWNELTNEEKSILAALYPAPAAEQTSTTACTSTSTTTVTLTVTTPGSKSAELSALPTTAASTATNAVSVVLSSSSPLDGTSAPTSRPVVSSHTTWWGNWNSTSAANGLAGPATGTAAGTGTGTGSATPTALLPTWTAGAGVVTGNMVSAAMAAIVGAGFAFLG